MGNSVTAIASSKLGKMISFNSDSEELNNIAEHKISKLNELLEILE